MKKKLPVILGAVFIVAALAVMLLFVFGGENTDEPAMDLTGSWKIVANIAENVPEIPEDDTVVFEEDQAVIYRTGEVFASSSYKLGAVRLELPEMSRNYDFTKISDDLIKLVMTAENYMFLYRLDGEEFAELDPALIIGKWDVLCHGGSAVTGESAVFTDGKFALYRSGESEPSINVAYEWNENVLSINDMGMNMNLLVQTPDQIIMVESSTGYVWELQKASE